VYSSNSLGFAERTHDFVKEQFPILRKVIAGKEKKDAAMGLIFASPFMSLVKFDMVKGFPYDYMHGTLLGVVKRITCCILDATRDKEYRLGTKGKPLSILCVATDNVVISERKSVDERWNLVRVSSGTDRRVRPLNTVAQWKAHEWKTWLLVWIPVLKDNIDYGVLVLLSKFTLGILLLLQDTITIETVDHSRSLLEDFCATVERIFGIEQCTFNVHILSHVATTVRNWGPLWFDTTVA